MACWSWLSRSMMSGAWRAKLATIMFDAIAGHDPHDSTSLDAPPANTFAGLKQGIRGLRIGIDRNYALKGIDGGQARAIEAALGVIANLGAAARRRRHAGPCRHARRVDDHLHEGDRGGAREKLSVACE